MTTLGRAAGWSVQVATWSFVIAVAAVLAATVAVPRIAGATPYTVLSSSMEPGMPAGSLVVVRPVDPDELGVGAVITYQMESGRPQVVTHRVVAVVNAIDGERRFLTQGDANEEADPEPVRPVQIKGERWYALPRLGHVNELLTGGQRQVAVYLVGSLLLGYAAFMFTASIVDRRRNRRGESVQIEHGEIEHGEEVLR